MPSMFSRVWLQASGGRASATPRFNRASVCATARSAAEFQIDAAFLPYVSATNISAPSDVGRPRERPRLAEPEAGNVAIKSQMGGG
jgi:hypothetical protein